MSHKPDHEPPFPSLQDLQDPHTGAIADLPRAKELIEAALKEKDFSMVTGFCVDGLALAEDPTLRYSYMTWMVKTAERQGHDATVLFYARRMEDLNVEDGYLCVAAALSAQTIRAHVHQDDFEAARSAIDRTVGYLERAKRGESKESLPAAERGIAIVAESIEMDENILLTRLMFDGKLGVAQEIAEVRLLNPLSLEEERMLHSTLQTLAFREGRYGDAREHALLSERASIEAKDFALAAHAALAEMRLIDHGYVTGSAKEALRRADEHAKRYAADPASDAMSLHELQDAITHYYEDLS